MSDPTSEERLMQYLQKSCSSDTVTPSPSQNMLTSVLSDRNTTGVRDHHHASPRGSVPEGKMYKEYRGGDSAPTSGRDAVTGDSRREGAVSGSCAAATASASATTEPKTMTISPTEDTGAPQTYTESAVATRITESKHPNIYTDNNSNKSIGSIGSSSNNNIGLQDTRRPEIATVATPSSTSAGQEKDVQKEQAYVLDTKYCYRHNPRIRCNKMADKQQLTEIQKKLSTFSKQDQQTVTNVWSSFANSSSQQRALILQGLISQCCFPQLSVISHEISHLLKIDFLEMLPSELALKILCYLDCQSLCSAAQVSTKWKQLADDDRVWRYMCEQHIDRKCPQCGWGLPLMAVKKLQEKSSRKRRFSEAEEEMKAVKNLPQPLWKCGASAPKRLMRKKRPWKAVYSERYTVERHWRKGFYSVKKFEGHTDGVLCCQYDNNKLLMTGSYDTSIKIWNTDTGELIRTLTGHTMGVKSLIYDDQKLISGGLDCTIKVWNWRTGECISSYTGHREGVISVDFLDKVIVSGSADKTIKVWHVDIGTCYTLRGHSDWVTCVKIHSKSRTLFSASDDSTVRLWDLETNKYIGTYGGVENGGHTAQVQCVIPFTYTDDLVTDVANCQKTSNAVNDETGGSNSEVAVFDSDDEEDDGNIENSNNVNNNVQNTDESDFEKFVKTRRNLPTHLLTASLDNTIKLWDVKTGKCIRTQFGHIEGVWSIAADTFRIVSGAHDKSIKIWDLQNGQCMHTLANASSVSCVGLGDSRIVCGLENGEVKMYCFDCNER